MKFLSIFLPAALGLSACAPVEQSATPTSPPQASVPELSFTLSEMCAKAIGAGRMGELSQNQCECAYGQAQETLSPELATRLFQALYTGQSQMGYIDSLSGTELKKAVAEMRALEPKFQACLS